MRLRFSISPFLPKVSYIIMSWLIPPIWSSKKISSNLRFWLYLVLVVFSRNIMPDIVIVVAQSLSCLTLCDPMDYSTPGSSVFIIFQRWLKFMSVASVMLSISSSSAFSFSFKLSQHQDLFQWVSSSHQVAKVLEPRLQHQSFQWIFRISFRMDWFYSLAVQGTLKSLLQHHSSKASILQTSFWSNSHIHTWLLEKP